MKHLTPTLLASATLALPAATQGHVPLVPFEHTGDLFVSDSSNDNVVRLVDLDLNGDFNGPGEITVFYDEDLGPQTLGNNNGLAFALDGALYVSDTSEDQIFRLLDANGDGDCHDAGELTSFFDGDPLVNLSGLELVSPSRITVDVLGRVWVAEANNGGGGIDSIVLLTDTNFDGDANDLGEAIRYYEPITSGSTGDSIPNDVIVGADQRIYYIEGGATGVVPKDVYRLEDLDGDGVIDPLTEVTTFFSPPAQPKTPFFWSLTQDGAGYFYTADSGNELVWRFRDENGDNVIDPVTEAVIWWQEASSLIWDLEGGSDGALYVCESQSPDRVLRLFDADGNGTVDPLTEVTAVYDEGLAVHDIANPRAMAFERRPTLIASPTTTVGGTYAATTLATVGDIVLTWWSGATSAPLPLAPFGELELLPGAGSGLLYTGVVAASGTHDVLLPVPNDASLSGLTLFTQGFVGKPDRFQLGNLQATTIL